MTLDQNGNATMIGLLFLMSVSVWAVIGLKEEAILAKRLKTRLHTYLCAKTLNGATKALINKVEILNKAIVIANTASLNPTTAAAGKAAKKAAQIGQQLAQGQYYKNLFDLFNGNCSFGPIAYLAPYKHKGMLTRSALGLAQLRRKKWNQKTLSAQVILDTEFSTKADGVQMETNSYEIQMGLSQLKSL